MLKDKYEFKNDKQLSRKEKIFYIKIFNELDKLMGDVVAKEGNNKEQLIKALEDNLYKVIKQYPELLYVKKYVHLDTTISGTPTWDYDYGRTFLSIIQNYHLDGLIEELCNDVEIYKTETYASNTLFFGLIPREPDEKYQHTVDTYNKKKESLISALEKFPELLSFTNQWGDNFAGEIISNFKPNSDYLKPFIPYILESLNNPEIATQQNHKGYNLGMLCAKYKHQELFDIAYQNTKTRMQKNSDGDTMEMIANNNGLIIPPLSDEQVYDFYNEIVGKQIEDICK